MGIIHSSMLERLPAVLFIAWFSVMSPQANALIRSKPQPIKPPELILFSENQQSVTYKVDEKDKAVAALFGAADNEKASEQSQPVLVYIHGRALGHIKNDYDEEPGESKKCCIPELFSRYHASKVLMFHWPHWGNSNDYNGPAQDAKSSGAALGELLAAIDQAAKEKKLNGPLILISHSMGSIVLAGALTKSLSLDLNSFHTVAVFSPASRYDKSWIWLSKIKSTNRYVFSNEQILC